MCRYHCLWLVKSGRLALCRRSIWTEKQSFVFCQKRVLSSRSNPDPAAASLPAAESSKKDLVSPANSPASEPVIFVAKYKELLDTAKYDVGQWKVEQKPKEKKADKGQTNSASINEQGSNSGRLSQSNVDYLVKAVNQTNSFENLTSKLNAADEGISRSAAGWKPAAAAFWQWKKLPAYYMQLSKSRLTLLVAITSAGGYGMAPCETFDAKLFGVSTLGVMLISASANSINQYLEVPFDSQMNRTKNRVLVRGLLTPAHALGFAAATATSGSILLGSLVNPTAMWLGLANLVLYTGVYTPMKRLSVANTWVGSVVGAIPPLIGWASASGGTVDAGAFVLAGILFAWQFPHFNALSWNLRPDYSRAGYRMMSVTEPGLCRRTTLRYSLACVGICSVAAPLLELTTPSFALESLPLNLYLTHLSWKFYREPDAASSRKLFRFTLIHLPLLMTLLFIAKTRQSHAVENLKNADQ